MRHARIALKLTYRCPGHCQYCECRKELWKTRGRRDMPLGMIQWLCRRLTTDPDPPFEEIHLSGGEVTTLENFPDTAKRLAATGLPLSATTAGWCRRQGNWAELLSSIPFRKLNVSIDHPDPASNDAVRGAGSWERAMRAVRDGVTIRDRLGYPEVTVITVVHRRNIRALEQLWKLLREWQVDRWMPAYLEATASYHDLAPTPDDLIWLKATRTLSEPFDHALGPAFLAETSPRSLITEGIWPPDSTPQGCAALGRLLIVHPNGDVYGCYGSEHAAISPVGRISAPDLPSFRELLAIAARTIPQVCRTCPEPVQHSNPLR